MKHLLAYKGFCRFTKQWDVITLAQNSTVLRVKDGPVMSDSMHIDSNGRYQGTVIRQHSCLLPWSTAHTEDPIKIMTAGTAGDSFAFSLPQKFHKVPQFHVHYHNTIQQCILVDDSVYAELKRIGITT